METPQQVFTAIVVAAGMLASNCFGHKQAIDTDPDWADWPRMLRVTECTRWFPIQVAAMGVVIWLVEQINK